MAQKIVDFGALGVNGRLDVTLLRVALCVDGGQVVDGGPGLGQLEVGGLQPSVGRIEERLKLGEFSLKSGSLAISDSEFLEKFLKMFLFKLNFKISNFK